MLSDSLESIARTVMDGEHVNFVRAHDAVHDPIRSCNDFADGFVRELQDRATRFRKLSEPIHGAEQAAHDKPPRNEASRSG